MPLWTLPIAASMRLASLMADLMCTIDGSTFEKSTFSTVKPIADLPYQPVYNPYMTRI